MGKLKNFFCECEQGYKGFYCDRKVDDDGNKNRCPINSYNSLRVNFWSKESYCVCKGDELSPKEIIKKCPENCKKVNCTRKISSKVV
ncbi:hypothetical protein HZS_7333 [Henneguya salminicola]|nr:hypothetical protein HZS_7333 [Henneguya salminicola]